VTFLSGGSDFPEECCRPEQYLRIFGKNLRCFWVLACALHDILAESPHLSFLLLCFHPNFIHSSQDGFHDEEYYFLEG
jgi:hypothetical protein